MANPLLVFEGDSITALNGAIGNDLGWAAKLVASITSPAPAGLQSSNLAVSGSTTVSMAARSGAVDALFDAARPWQVLYVWIGTNDLTMLGSTPATVYTNIVNYCQARRAVGFKVVIFTITPNHGSASATFEADRQTLSANIRANWATFADGLADVAADATLGPAAASFDSSLFYDGLHITAKGHWYSASIARDQLQILVPSIQMALSANVVWEVRASGASDNNGGGFVIGSGGTDYSQQNAAQLTLTDLATTGVVTTVTSATGGFTAAMVGNILNIASGTNFTAGLYQILTRVDTNTITLDRAPTTAAGSGGTGSVGGAFATLGKLAAAFTVGSNKAYATGAFSSTATTTFAPAGVTPAGAVPQSRLIGYGATRGDTGHATLTLATNTGLTGISATASGFAIENFDVDCASLGTSTGIQITGAFSEVRNCKVSNFTVKGIRLATNTQIMVIDCEVTGGTAAATAGIELTTTSASAVRCHIHDNLCAGISIGPGAVVDRCLVVNNTGTTSDGITANLLGGGWSLILHNTVHGNGRDGFRSSNLATLMQVRNNLFTGNGVSAAGYGLNSPATAGPATADIDGNAYFGNATGARNNCDSTSGIFGQNPYANVRDVTLAVSPYLGPTTGATANFGLNNTALCRAAAAPSAFPGNTGTAGYLDMGAVQTRGAVMGNPSLEGV